MAGRACTWCMRTVSLLDSFPGLCAFIGKWCGHRLSEAYLRCHVDANPHCDAPCSSWKNSLLSDHERPLNRRGIRSADDLGQHLSGTEFEPQIVISSDSTRTTETWHGMWSHLPRADIHFGETFISADYPTFRLPSEIPTSVERVMVLGHNPGFSLAAGWLSGLHIDSRRRMRPSSNSRLR